jgi:glycosyltransferase involved in cell wall biosynthesis
MNKYYICLPVFNGGSYFVECLESILSQSYELFELLIFDNNSCDGSVEYALKLNDKRILVIRSAKTLDICQNWQRINDYFRDRRLFDNEFLTLIGHDDLLKPTFLNSMNELIAQSPASSVYNTHFELINSDGDVIRSCKPIPERLNYVDLFKLRCWGHLDVYGTGYVFRAKDYVKVGGINTTFPKLLFSDDLLFLQLTKLSNMATLDKSEYFYRLHKSTSNSITMDRANSFFLALLNYLRFVENHVFTDIRFLHLRDFTGLLVFRHIHLFESRLYKIFYKYPIYSTIATLKEGYITRNAQKKYIYFFYGNNKFSLTLKSRYNFLRYFLNI